MLGGRYAREGYGDASLERPADTAQGVRTPGAKQPFSPTSVEFEQTGETLGAPEGEQEPEGEPVVEEPAGESQSKYVIQAMSTSNRDDARTARDTILAAGFHAGIFEADLPGRGKWYRVYVGPYESEDDARRAIGTVQNIPGFEGSFLKEMEQQ